MNLISLPVLALLALAVAAPAMAQDMMIFPNNGQSQEQQDQDRGACHVWAVNQSGFAPAASPPWSFASSRRRSISFTSSCQLMCLGDA